MIIYNSEKQKGLIDVITISHLYKIAYDNNIMIDNFNTRELESFSMPNIVVLNKNKLRTTKSLKVHLAHELGHCQTGSFYNINTLETRERMEYRADRWAIKKLIPFPAFLNALENGITERWELAEHFNVTEDYIDKAQKLYEEKLLEFNYYEY